MGFYGFLYFQQNCRRTALFRARQFASSIIANNKKIRKAEKQFCGLKEDLPNTTQELYRADQHIGYSMPRWLFRIQKRLNTPIQNILTLLVGLVHQGVMEPYYITLVISGDALPQVSFLGIRVHLLQLFLCNI